MLAWICGRRMCGRRMCGRRMCGRPLARVMMRAHGSHHHPKRSNQHVAVAVAAPTVNEEDVEASSAMEEASTLVGNTS